MIKYLSIEDREFLMEIAEQHFGIVATAVEHIDALEKEVDRLRGLAKAADEHRLEMIRWAAAKKAEQHPALRPLDRIPEVDELVWWDDPDDSACSGWYRVEQAGPHYEDVVRLVIGDGSVAEAYCHELYREVEA